VSSSGVELPPEQLRFHLYRLGSRARVARLFGAKTDRVCQALPMQDIDRLRDGEPVLIGKILAKRCTGCGVARELEQFLARQDTRSGCRSVCEHCRGK
jgi:hypothetical protein